MEAFAAGVLVGAGLAVADPLLRSLRAPGGPDSSGAADRSPLRFRPRDWVHVVIGAVREFGSDRIPAVAASVTFYILLALFPALSAFVSLYGLIGDASATPKLLQTVGSLLPGGAVGVLDDQLTRLARADHSVLGFAFALSFGVSVWSANAGAKATIDGLNVAYEAPERRGFVRLTLLSLAFTATALVFAVAGAALLGGAPATLARLGIPSLPATDVLRWIALFVVSLAAIALLYRFAPSHAPGGRPFVAPGAALSAAAWLLMSALFSWYVAHFGHYDRTYGSLGAIVGFLTWIWLSLMVVLFGAELNAEVARQG